MWMRNSRVALGLVECVFYQRVVNALVEYFEIEPVRKIDFGVDHVPQDRVPRSGNNLEIMPSSEFTEVRRGIEFQFNPPSRNIARHQITDDGMPALRPRLQSSIENHGRPLFSWPKQIVLSGP